MFFVKMKRYPHNSQIEIEFTLETVLLTTDSMEFGIGLRFRMKMILLRIMYNHSTTLLLMQLKLSSFQEHLTLII